jgi:hypothetical protein
LTSTGVREPEPSNERPRSGTAELYAERAARHQALATELGGRSRLVSNLRGLAFAVALVAALTALFGKSPAAAPLAFAGFVAFIALVVWHAKIIVAEAQALRLTRVNLDARARVTDDWHTLRDSGARFASKDHPYSGDLDIFGAGSLYQRLNVGHTRFGQETLARFLSEAAEPEAVRLRQHAAKALAPCLDERQILEAASIAVVEPPPDLAQSGTKKRPPVEPPDPEPFLSWAEERPRLSTRPGLALAAHVLPPITVALSFGARLVGLPAWCWTVPFVLQILLVVMARGDVDRVFRAVSSTEGAFLRYASMFEVMEGLEVDSELVANLKRTVLSGAARPSTAMRRFERVLGWFELRHNGLVHPFVDAFLLWDIHCVLRLEAWQRDAGTRARAWFGAVGELEALSALGGFAFDEPSFTFPEIVAGGAQFEARELAHPLLPRATRVANDVALRSPGRALLITGSNMSGKSTLLRSMGVAGVLALAGAPVCATSLVLSPLAVRTSMRVSDSLTGAVSHFYAEITRLKGVLDATNGSTNVFFLLDEILHGTNSTERQIGARAVLAALLACGAIGAVSTHDEGLCHLPEPLMSSVEQLHFRESIDNEVMTFDYRLRPGPVVAGNALHLMRSIGLPVPVDDQKP